MPPAWSETEFSFCFLLILLVPLAAVGLAAINTGLGRSRSAAHSLLSAISVIAVAALVYFVCGYSWQGMAGRPSHSFLLAGKSWNWIAAEPFFFRGLRFDASPAPLAAWLEMLSVGLATMIPLTAGADRWRLGASCASTALLAGCTYPLFAHWVWGGGWLAQIGANYGLGHGFLDNGGAGSIHVVGGLTALSVAWLLGPRRAKYTSEGVSAAIPGHNIVLVLLGCLLAWAGWLGLNSAASILFNNGTVAGALLVVVNTTLSAAAGGLAAVVVTGWRFGRPDASLCANGWVAGLVAGSAGCAVITPSAAILIGMVAGALVSYSVEFLELKMGVDDPGGAIAVHGISGLWGPLAVGVFLSLRDPLSHSGQWLAQLVGVATLLGFVLPLTYFLNWLLHRLSPQRVRPEGERQGMDLYELGAGAYPEFVIHRDELT